MECKEVFELIDGERTYQERLWNGSTTVLGNEHRNKHSLEEWFLYIEDYVSEAKHILSRIASPDCDREASSIMRKVAALAVVALEQHGAESRGLPVPEIIKAHGIAEMK